MLVDRRFRMARKWSNKMLKQMATLFAGEVVNVSAWDDRDKEGGYYKDYFSKASAYHYTNYIGLRGLQQQENEYPLDLTRDLPEELRRRFDVAFNHTTLEHIFEIKKAFENLCEMSKDVVIVIVPFSQAQHELESYKDYWRFTPSCMRELFRTNGLEVIWEVESKLRRSAIYLMFVGSRYPERWKDLIPTFEPIKEAGSWIGFTWWLRIHTLVKRIIGRNVVG